MPCGQSGAKEVQGFDEGPPKASAEVDVDNPAALDAMAQAAMVREKQVTARELVDAAIGRIERLNPHINAVVTTCFERAREQAARPRADGPFAGVPILVKDLTAFEGTRLTFGSACFRDYVAPYTHEVVRRLEQAGFIVLGKTNTPEFGILPTTEPRLHGPTRNPWHLAHSAGGSSGGAAAAVAAGMVPVAHASDGGGSIRIPASACGLFGMKISRGRNPELPEPTWHGFGVHHCVSRSVRDSAAVLDATQGPAPGDRWWAPPPSRPYLQEVGAPPGRLRVAFTTTDSLGRRAHADCVAAVESTARLCESLGHHVEEAAPQIDGNSLTDAFLFLWGVGVAASIKEATRLMAQTGADAFEPITRGFAGLSANREPADVGLAWRPLLQIGYVIARFLQTYDVLLTPVLARPPVPIGTISQEMPFDTLLALLIEYVAYTPTANVTGQPAMSVPLSWTSDGLPVGSHFTGRFGDEATLFRLAAQLEHAQPWAERWPPASVVSTARVQG